MTTLELLTRAERMLAEVASAPAAQDIIDLAEAARVLAKSMDLGTAAVNHATTIKLKAERRLAEIVDEGQARGEIATQGAPGNVRSPDVSPATLDDLGVDRRRLSEARAIRDTYTDDDIDTFAAEANNDGEELSRHELVHQAREHQRAKTDTPPRAKPEPTAYDHASPIFDALGRFNAACERAGDLPSVIAAAIDQHPQPRLQRGTWFAQVQAAIDNLSALRDLAQPNHLRSVK